MPNDKTKTQLDPQGVKSAMDRLNAKYGDGTVRLLGKDPLPPLEFVSTGIKELDKMIGGGIPKGRMIMVYGPEGAGKSSFCYHVAKFYQLVLYVDAENSYTEERAKVFGVDPKKVIHMRPEWGEQAVDAIVSFAKEGIPLIIVDSVPALTPKREFDNEDAEKQAGIALFAAVLSRKIFGIANICSKSGTSIIFINQVRDKLNAMAFGEQTTLPGGHALKQIGRAHV